MKKIILLIFAIYSVTAAGQNLRVGVGFGYGEYKQRSLKDFQTLLAKEMSGLPIKAVEQFPDYYNYTTSIEYEFKNRCSLGVCYLHCSSGGRNHLADYSGEYKLDMIVKGNGFSLFQRIGLFRMTHFDTYFQFKESVILSSLNLNEHIVINNVSSNSSNYDFITRAISFEPGAGVRLSYLPRTTIILGVGYQVDYESKFWLKGSKSKKLRDRYGAYIYSNWTGMRYQLGFIFTLF
ncbi:MAG: hypothetical protein HXX16_16220 [Bacteroidales bacterium]|nr:hypothetical protein [Bacteroidales bacterium]